ncbi:MAG: LytTR family DNA-binding domain-containing protein [Lachnospiraceae bacterium]
MYQIAICDSEIAELDRVERILASGRSPLAGSAFLIRRFISAEDLLRKVEAGYYQPDILLMGVNEPEGAGIDAVRRMRGMGNNGKVILFAASAEYALAAFGVAAVSYLLKPVSEKALFGALDRILEDMGYDRHHYVLLEVGSHIRRFTLKDIVYCEAQGKKQYMCLRGGEYVLLRKTMTQLRKLFCSHRQFVEIGVSYIVNLEHVERWDRQTLLLDNGQEIYLPRGAYQRLPVF